MIFLRFVLQSCNEINKKLLLDKCRWEDLMVYCFLQKSMMAKGDSTHLLSLLTRSPIDWNITSPESNKNNQTSVQQLS